MPRIEVGIVLRVAPGAAPVVIGAVADDGLLRHALRLAIDAAARRVPCEEPARADMNLLLANGSGGRVM